MDIRISKIEPNRWGFTIHAKNGTVVANSERLYANRRNAVAAGKLIAGSKLKLVIEE